MSSFLEFGKTTIKVPNKMIFVNKQGYDNLTNPVTKSGAIASRFGVKSLKVEPTEGNKIEIIESAPREMKIKPKAQSKPRTKKTNNKKEVEDLLGEMMNTKISKKIEMPEIPEPKVKKVKKVKQMMEVEPEETEDTISANLQKLIYTSSIDKIKKSLNDLKYKGRMNTNKVLLNMQLLQNLDTKKQKELIKLLE